MSGKLLGLGRRLAHVEKSLAATAEEEKLVNCICKQPILGTVVFSWDPEKLEAEMNQRCPAHGFRDLGRLIIFNAEEDGGMRCDTSRIDDLLVEYEARKSRYTRTKLEQAHQET